MVIMIITDLIIGNISIFLFTWSGFLIPTFIGIILDSLKNSRLNSVMKVTTGGIMSVLFFFLWTNFGVVLLTNMYTKYFAGLLQSYINAIPFLRNQLFSVIVTTPALFYCSKYFLEAKELKLNLKSFLFN